MIWKILFFVTTIIFVLLGIPVNDNSGDGYEIYTNLDYFLDTWFNIAIAFVMGLFYSLGWKQRIFSKVSSNIFFVIFILFIMVCLLLMMYYGYPEIYNETQNPALITIIMMMCFTIGAVITNIPLIPIYIGFYKYKTNIDNLEVTERPYWKLFSILYIASIISALLGAIPRYTHFSSYTILDFCCLIACIYEIVFLIGYSWNKKIFNKLFWQITSVPYVITATCLAPFFTSETFNKDFQIVDAISKSNILEGMLIIAISITCIFAIFKYAFGKETDKKIA